MLSPTPDRDALNRHCPSGRFQTSPSDFPWNDCCTKHFMQGRSSGDDIHSSLYSLLLDERWARRDFQAVLSLRIRLKLEKDQHNPRITILIQFWKKDVTASFMGLRCRWGSSVCIMMCIAYFLRPFTDRERGFWRVLAIRLSYNAIIQCFWIVF